MDENLEYALPLPDLDSSYDSADSESEMDDQPEPTGHEVTAPVTQRVIQTKASQKNRKVDSSDDSDESECVMDDLPEPSGSKVTAPVTQRVLQTKASQKNRKVDSSDDSDDSECVMDDLPEPSGSKVTVPVPIHVTPTKRLLKNRKHPERSRRTPGKTGQTQKKGSKKGSKVSVLFDREAISLKRRRVSTPPPAKAKKKPKSANISIVTKTQRQSNLNQILVSDTYEHVQLVGRKGSVWGNYVQLLSKTNNVIVFPECMFCVQCLEQNKYQRYSLNTASTNLKRHMQVEHGFRDPASAESIEALKIQKLDKKSKDFKASLATAITKLCTLDQLSFNIVNGEGFRAFCMAAGLIEKGDDLPSRESVGFTHLTKLADACVAGVKLVLKEQTPKSVNFCFDIWSNPKGRSFLNVYASFVTPEFDLVNLLLAFKSIQTHSAVEIKRIVEETIVTYKLTEHERTATTDGGSDCKAACSQMNMSRDHCLAHILHLLVNDVLKEVPQLHDVINHYKAVCRALTFASDSLRTVVQMDAMNKMADLLLFINDMDEKLTVEKDYHIFTDEEEGVTYVDMDIKNFKSLRNSIPTRWPSILVMLKGFQGQTVQVNQMLLSTQNEDLVLKKEQTEVLDDLIQFFTIINKFSVFMQSGSEPTINCIIGLKAKLLQAFSNFEKDTKFDLMKHVAATAATRLKERVQIEQHHILATLMDPKLKRTKALQELLFEQNLEAADIINEAVQKYCQHTSTTNIATPGTSQQNSRPQFPEQNVRRSLFDDSDNEDNIEHDEVTKYLLHPLSNEEPLKWWRDNQGLFPQLSIVARNALGRQASSAQAERGFSAAGSLITKQRSNLTPFTAEMCLMVHENYHILQKLINLGD